MRAPIIDDPDWLANEKERNARAPQTGLWLWRSFKGPRIRSALPEDRRKEFEPKYDRCAKVDKMLEEYNFLARIVPDTKETGNTPE